MNWYKRANDLFDLISTPEGYTQIGHSDYEKMDIDHDYPNYMWYYYDGLLVKEETGDEPGHGEAWPSLQSIDEKLYKGRYDSSQNIITILRPIRKQFNEIPSFIIRELKNKFGKDAEIREF